MQRFLVAGFLLCGLFQIAGAQVSVLRPAASTRMTLYAPDLAWVEESRPVTLRQGLNTLRMDFILGNIDLDSVLVAAADHPSEIALKASKRNSEWPRALFLEVESQREGVEAFRVAYAIRGISARTRYVLFFDEGAGVLSLSQKTDVDNKSGEDYAAAAARVVWGEVHTVPGGPSFGRSAEAKGEAAPPPGEVLKQGFSEHQLYTLPAPADYPNGEVRTVPSLEAPKVAVVLRLDYDLRKNASRVMRVLEGKNTAESGLGSGTLPAGPWQLYLKDAEGTTRFLRSGNLGAIPPGKEIKIEMGPDPDVVVERKLMDYKKIDLKYGEYNRQLVSYGTEESLLLEFRNHKGTEVEITVLEPITGTAKWEIAESSIVYKKKDAQSIEFKVKVPAREKLQLTYRVKKHEIAR